MRHSASRIIVSLGRAFCVTVVLFVMGCVSQPRPMPPQSATATKEPFKPMLFTVYCPEGQVKFADPYWAEVVRAKDEFLWKKGSCFRILGYAHSSGGANLETDRQFARDRAEWVKICMKQEGIDEKFISETLAMDPQVLPPGAGEDQKKPWRKVEIHLVDCLSVGTPAGPSYQIDPFDPFRYKK